MLILSVYTMHSTFFVAKIAYNFEIIYRSIEIT